MVAQLIQAFSPVSFLSSFEIWQSGALPYPLLVAFQFMIIIACMRVVRSVLCGTVVPSDKKGRFFLALGWVYLIAMGMRLLVGLTIAPDHYWFSALDRSISVITLLRYVAYPILLLACLFGNMLLLRQGTGFVAATYVPVTLGTLLVMALEGMIPYRADWRPSRAEVVQDSTFLALVHVVLPKALPWRRCSSSSRCAMDEGGWWRPGGRMIGSCWPKPW